MAGGACDADAAAHAFDEAPAEDEAGVAVVGGGGSDLGEGREETVEALGGEADAGVVDGELEEEAAGSAGRVSRKPRGGVDEGAPAAGAEGDEEHPGQGQ